MRCVRSEAGGGHAREPRAPLSWAPPRLMLTGPSQQRHSSPFPPHGVDALGAELLCALRRIARASQDPGQGPRCGREPPPFTTQAKTIVSLKQLCIQAHTAVHSACQRALHNAPHRLAHTALHLAFPARGCRDRLGGDVRPAASLRANVRGRCCPRAAGHGALLSASPHALRHALQCIAPHPRAGQERQQQSSSSIITSTCACTCDMCMHCLLYTSPSPRDEVLSRMPSSA